MTTLLELYLGPFSLFKFWFFYRKSTVRWYEIYCLRSWLEISNLIGNFWFDFFCFYSWLHVKHWNYNLQLMLDKRIKPLTRNKGPFSYSRCDFFYQKSTVRWCEIHCLIPWFEISNQIGNFWFDFFFLWLLISYQTSKLRPKINFWNKNKINDRKIKSCWINMIWNLLLDLTWFIFAVFDVKSFWLLIFMWQRKRALA